MNELSALCDINVYDLIFISETWFTEISASELNNYSLQAVDRQAYSCMLLGGDFNFPDIKWHDDDRIELLSGQNSAASLFLDTLVNHNFEQSVDFSIFGASNGKAKNILDLIITDLSTKVINLYSSLPLATLIREYRKLRSQVQKACKRRVRVFEAQLASDKSNPKRVYANAKAQQNVHVSISAISDAKGEMLTEGIHIANRLNEHFKSVFVDDSKSSQLPIFERRHYQEDSGDIIINFEATLAYLKGLNPNKSIGADNVSPKVLIEYAAQMTYPLTLLYNKALSEGSTPTAWTQSHVTPLFKKGSRLDAANYRPVSITSAPCKVMEKNIREQITKYLEKTSCISHNQHGFMSKKGCTSNLLESVDYITKALSKKFFVGIAFLDFAKAFDKVSHRRLLHKLKA
ncbi:uncharacterized protein LOC136089527 [Hydra vulgaris]|uniref:Uncharacterized protein LOC136089527 n=1 Tax=Hydra vulgaris TaxID=6087 RepID=A0ABM4DBD2_HYDVU